MKLYDETGELVSLDLAGPNDGEVLAYDAGLGKWRPAASAGGARFYELMPAVSHHTSSEYWENWDLSQDIPEGATAVEIVLYNCQAEPYEMGAARKGSSLARAFTVKQDHYVTLTVPVTDASRIIRIKGGATATDQWLVGYWK